MIFSIRKTFVAALILAATAFVSAPAVMAKDGPVVMYAGIGFLPNRAEPIVASIFNQDSKGDAKILGGWAKAAEAAAKAARIGWSSHPVMVHRREASAWLKQMGRPVPGNVTVKDLQNAAGEVLYLSVVLDTNVQAAIPNESGAADQVFLAWATAFLSVPATGDVVLVATGSHEIQVRAEKYRASEARALMGAVYRQAGVNAIRQLAALTQRHRRDAGFDTMMVSRIVLDDPKAYGRFQSGPSPSSLEPLCDEGRQCKGPWCERLFGVTAQIVTRALNKAGFATLAPHYFGGWGKAVKRQLKTRFSLSGATIARERSLRITVSTALASNFVVAVLPRLSPEKRSGKTDHVSWRNHTAGIELHVFRKAGRGSTCRGDYADRLPAVLDGKPVPRAVFQGDGPINDNLHRALDLIALQNAGAAMGCRLQGKKANCK